MELSSSHALITGGAGFVGSHLAEHLVFRGATVTVADDLSNGNRAYVPEKASFVDADLSTQEAAASAISDKFDIIFHLAARKDPNDDDPQGQFRENTDTTHSILRAAREADVHRIAYTSSSTVYGEAPRPTPEDYAPLEPISVYGASKLADEGLLSTYAHSHGLTVFNFRFANVVGPRLRGAVIPDFIEKLREDSRTLRILGDGKQEKSYLHIEDCITAMLNVVERAENQRPERQMRTYNLGTRTTTSVNRIAEIVCDVLDVEPNFKYSGGDRGWTGDVPRMRLSIEKISELGWQPKYTSDEAVEKAANELVSGIYGVKQ